LGCGAVSLWSPVAFLKRLLPLAEETIALRRLDRWACTAHPTAIDHDNGPADKSNNVNQANDYFAYRDALRFPCEINALKSIGLAVQPEFPHTSRYYHGSPENVRNAPDVQFVR
jgi:hypothetical protein